MPSPYDEATGLFPALGKYRKLILSVLVTAAPLVLFLTTSTHSAKEIIPACVAYVLANFGVYAVPNDPPAAAK